MMKDGPMIWTYLLVAALTLWEGNLEIVPIHRSWDKRAWPSSVDGFGFGYDDVAGSVSSDLPSWDFGGGPSIHHGSSLQL